LNSENGTDVFFNGRFIGFVSSPDEFSVKARKIRRSGQLPREMSIRFDKELDYVAMSTEVGRVLRPLIVVEDGVSKLKDDHLVLLETEK